MTVIGRVGSPFKAEVSPVLESSNRSCEVKPFMKFLEEIYALKVFFSYIRATKIVCDMRLCQIGKELGTLGVSFLCMFKGGIARACRVVDFRCVD